MTYGKQEMLAVGHVVSSKVGDCLFYAATTKAHQMLALADPF